MIDPKNITKFNQTQEELEMVLFWWVLAAGKSGVRSAKQLDNFLQEYKDLNLSPFNLIKHLIKNNINIVEKLKSYGIGCYNHKSKSFIELANSNLDLKNCSLIELEKIHGVGKKTSRCFCLHSRLDFKCAGLDTHLLKFLNLCGFLNIPKSTPSSSKEYLRIEKIFLDTADKMGYSPSDLDLKIWNAYSQKDQDKQLDLYKKFKEK